MESQRKTTKDELASEKKYYLSTLQHDQTNYELFVITKAQLSRVSA